MNTHYPQNPDCEWNKTNHISNEASKVPCTCPNEHFSCVLKEIRQQNTKENTRGFCPQGLSRGEKHEMWHVDVRCPFSEVQTMAFSIDKEAVEKMKVCPSHGYSPDDEREVSECYGYDENYNSALNTILQSYREELAELKK